MADPILGSHDPRFQDLTGKTFGRWTVLGCAGLRGKDYRWRCRCACGAEREVFGGNLTRGGSKSCGCIRQPPLSQRLWSRIARGDGCWEWQGAKTAFGYGKLGVRGKYLDAHRLVYEMTYGPVPDGLWVLHRCDNPGCCRPDHLYLGTPGDNAQDRTRRDRAGRKLNNAKAGAIKRRRAAGESAASLAREFGVTRRVIELIVNGKAFRYAT